ncbi:MAG: M50 family metallopeptidase [Clostridia bacterium]|nr:M50 family metallopeptidase [Clostridia bacterium]
MKLGRIYGIQFIVNKFFLLLLIFYFFAGVLLKGVMVFLIVLIHELAHVAVALRYGLKVREVELLPFGGVARIEDFLEMDPSIETKIALAGPLANGVMLVAALGFQYYGSWQHPLLTYFIKCNIIMVVFNLLPALPLDGGRIYRAFLAPRVGLKNATEAAADMAKGIALFLFVLGGAGLYLGLTDLSFLVIVVFLYYASVKERGLAAFVFMRYLTRKKEELSKKGIIKAEHLVVSENTPLKDIIKYFVPRKFHLIVMMGPDWTIQRLYTETEIIDGLLTLGFDLPIKSLEVKP